MLTVSAGGQMSLRFAEKDYQELCVRRDNLARVAQSEAPKRPKRGRARVETAAPVVGQQKRACPLDQIFAILRLSPEREHKFHPARKFRFDYAFLDKKLAIEYEGIFSAKSRHTTVTGFMRDAEKYNEAMLLGWRVLRITADMIPDSRAIDYITRAVEGGK